MKPNEIPDDLRRFILTSIPSIPFLESLLLLRKDPAQCWTAAMLSQRLFVPEPRAAGLLAELEASGMARANDGSYCYAATGALDEMAGRVAASYASHLRLVTDLVHSAMDRRAFQFADAFKLRKD